MAFRRDWKKNIYEGLRTHFVHRMLDRSGPISPEEIVEKKREVWALLAKHLVGHVDGTAQPFVENAFSLFSGLDSVEEVHASAANAEKRGEALQTLLEIMMATRILEARLESRGEKLSGPQMNKINRESAARYAEILEGSKDLGEALSEERRDIVATHIMPFALRSKAWKLVAYVARKFEKERKKMLFEVALARRPR